MFEEHSDSFKTDVWITIGFTHHPERQKFALIKSRTQYDDEEADCGLCLACTRHLDYSVSAFCYSCKAPRPPDWTTGNKSLDTLLAKSWANTMNPTDSYLQWIEFSQLTNIQEASALNHECTHTADWSEPTTKTSRVVKVIIKKIVTAQDLISVR